MKQLSASSPEFAAVKGVFLIGNPQRLPGKQSNTDQNGAGSTDNATGISARLRGAGIPADWDTSGKVMDVCFTVRTFCFEIHTITHMNIPQGDGVCSGFTINAPHLAYPLSQSVQDMGTKFLTSKLE
jgi:hypothetical protein